jgi:hypothetical protein
MDAIRSEVDAVSVEEAEVECAVVSLLLLVVACHSVRSSCELTHAAQFDIRLSREACEAEASHALLLF